MTPSRKVKQSLVGQVRSHEKGTQSNFLVDESEANLSGNGRLGSVAAQSVGRTDAFLYLHLTHS